MSYPKDDKAPTKSMEFRCSVNERGCKNNCLGNRFHEADVDSFLTYTQVILVSIMVLVRGGS